MNEKRNEPPASPVGRIGLLIGLGLILAMGMLVWQFRTAATEREGSLQSRVEAMTRENETAQTTVQELNQKIEEFRPEKVKLQAELETADRNIKNLQSRINSFSDEEKKQQVIIWELQRRLLTDEKGRRAYNKQLRALWPLIEKKAPNFITKYEKLYSAFGPDGFISKEYEPTTYSGGTSNDPTWGGYVESFEGREWMLKDCVWSPDHQRCIWTCVDDCDVDADLYFIDLQAKLELRLESGGAATYYAFLTWLDNETFMYVRGESYEQVPPRLNIYRASPDVIFSRIGDHSLPPPL
jgi:hypothetical protein